MRLLPCGPCASSSRVCRVPLTAPQNYLRERGGQRTLSDSFINVYIRGHLFRRDDIGVAQVIVGALVIVSWAGIALRRRARAAASRIG